MTELQCLVRLMKVKKLPKEAQDIIDERLGEIETQLKPTPRPLLPVPSTQQAPSMQRIMDEIPTPNVAPIVAPIVQRALQKEEVVTSQSPGGGGYTKGPKKW